MSTMIKMSTVDVHDDDDDEYYHYASQEIFFLFVTHAKVDDGYNFKKSWMKTMKGCRRIKPISTCLNSIEIQIVIYRFFSSFLSHVWLQRHHHRKEYASTQITTTTSLRHP